MAYIEIDSESGFCFGVVKAISKAEQQLASSDKLYCLGDIVHNGEEVRRLSDVGLITIDHHQLRELKSAKVLLRAHGEPPTTYQIAKENGIEIIDASCPVVLALQKKIKAAYESDPQGQIVIYGKQGHAEVIGLVGQTEGRAIVIEKVEDLDRLDFTRSIYLFAQTTMSVSGFEALVSAITSRVAHGVSFQYNDTICRQVANRIPNIRTFAQRFDVVLFVSSPKSSNGKVLFSECQKVNSRTYFVNSAQEVSSEMVKGASSIGICGATSTPKWLMESVASEAKKMTV